MINKRSYCLGILETDEITMTPNRANPMEGDQHSRTKCCPTERDVYEGKVKILHQRAMALYKERETSTDVPCPSTIRQICNTVSKSLPAAATLVTAASITCHAGAQCLTYLSNEVLLSRADTSYPPYIG